MPDHSMDIQLIATVGLVVFWLYIIGFTMRTTRLIKNAYEEQYEFPAAEIQHGDDHREM
jgi:hypothetical protein